jgi:mannose-6-phosphate isomerase
MLYPLTFEPILMDRVWGGRNLDRLYHKSLPEGARIGESWEITDRAEAVSRIANGPLAGRDLRWLMTRHGAEVVGRPVAEAERFPLLLKILDAEQTLSLQVHPPAAIAAGMGGEPKTELWYVTHATSAAALFAGLRQGVTRADFERRIRDGTVAECFHRIPVRSGDAMFLPSGRVHALGAGNVIFEIQQNSDTTYRVFDWNRLGLDGKPRELHIDQSLACVDFEDFEPDLIRSPWRDDPPVQRRVLVRDPHFAVDALRSNAPGSKAFNAGECRILAIISGEVVVGGGDQAVRLAAGNFCLIPAALSSGTASWAGPIEFLEVVVGNSRAVGRSGELNHESVGIVEIDAVAHDTRREAGLP